MDMDMDMDMRFHLGLERARRGPLLVPVVCRCDGNMHGQAFVRGPFEKHVLYKMTGLPQGEKESSWPSLVLHVGRDSDAKAK